MQHYLFLFVFLFSCATVQRESCNVDQKYHRNDWVHWTDDDRDWQNTRQEILIARSKEAPLLSENRCRVRSGKWDDYYFPESLTRSKDVDIDHLIPLKHAHAAGGSTWSKDKKEKFANDPQNLVITNRRFNRQKGAKGIHQWLPPHKDYACRYIRDWFMIKNKYDLHVTDPERNTLKVSGCSLWSYRLLGYKNLMIW